MSSDHYTERFQVRLWEVTPAGALRASHLVRYLEQATINMPAPPSGPGAATIAELWLHRLAPAAHGDEVQVTTWISRETPAGWASEYDVRRPDGTRLARARIAWAAALPNKIAPPVLALGPWPGGPPDPLWSAAGPLQGAAPPEPESEPQATPHTVYPYEATPQGITAAAVYIDWLEAATGEALPGGGLDRPAPHPVEAAPELSLRALQIAYHQPTRPGDTVTITTVLDPDRADQISVAQHLHFGGFPVTIRTQRAPESAWPPAVLVEARTVYAFHAGAASRIPG